MKADQYWQTVAAIRNQLESIDDEIRARNFIDLLMSVDSAGEVMLDVFCNGRPDVRWWGIYYEDWC